MAATDATVLVVGGGDAISDSFHYVYVWSVTISKAGGVAFALGGNVYRLGFYGKNMIREEEGGILVFPFSRSRRRRITS